MVNTNKRFMFLLVLLTLASDAQARNVALLIGGGGNDSLRSASTFEASKFLQSMDSMGWETEALFGIDSGHGFKSRPFTHENLVRDLEFYSDSLKHGDELLINILTEGKFVRRGHGLALADGGFLSLDQREILSSFRKMKRNGVKVGVLDNSGYSGQTVEVLSRYACVVSSQTPDFPSQEVAESLKNHESLAYGVSSFTRSVLREFPDPTLEDLFIESGKRLGKTGVFPQMSGITEHNFEGQRLTWEMMALSDQLAQHRDRICTKDEVRGVKNVPVNRFFDWHWMMNWTALHGQVDQKEIKLRHDRLKDFSNDLDRLMKEKDRVLGDRRGQPGEQSTRMEKDFEHRLERLLEQKQVALNEFSNALNRIHTKDYVQTREWYQNRKVVACRDFKLNPEHHR